MPHAVHCMPVHKLPAWLGSTKLVSVTKRITYSLADSFSISDSDMMVQTSVQSIKIFVPHQAEHRRQPWQASLKVCLRNSHPVSFLDVVHEEVQRFCPTP